MDCGHDPRDFYVHRCDVGTPTPRSSVHALVIGTSKYRYKHRGDSTYEKLRDVPGAALGAGKFAKFLRDKYRDPLGREIATIRLLLTPMADEEERALNELGVIWRPAAYAGVQTALKDWFADCDTSSDNISVLYAAGHGITRLRSFSHVFLQAEGNEPEAFYFSLNISAIQEALEYNYSQTKIVITDCCAQVFVPPRFNNGILLEPKEERIAKLMNIHRPCEPLHIAGARTGAKAYALGASEGTMLSYVLERLLHSAGELVHHPVEKNEQYFAITQPRMSDLVHSVFRSHPKAKNIPNSGPCISGQTVTGGLHRPTPPPEFEIEFVAVDHANSDPVEVTITTMGGVTLAAELVSPGHPLVLKLPPGKYIRKLYSGQAEFIVDRPARFDALSGDLL